MTKMLASVANLAEAIVVLETDVDIIDLKNPLAGALGALPDKEIRAIVQAVAGLKPVSATIGDLPMDPYFLMCATEQTAKAGVNIIKIGFFGPKSHRDCIKALKPLANRGVRMVAVLFADQTPDFSLLPELKAAGFYGVMLDTAEKNGTNLLDHVLLEDVQGFIDMANTHGLQSGLAGSLSPEHIAPLARLKPGYIGFRGALCINLERKAALSKTKVQEMKALLLRNNMIFTNVISV